MKKLLMIALVCAATFSLKANVEGSFMISMFSSGQLPGPMTHLKGGRLMFLYGECQELFGLGHVVGADAADFQLGGLVDSAESELDGCQIGLVNIASNHKCPVLPFVNIRR